MRVPVSLWIICIASCMFSRIYAAADTTALKKKLDELQVKLTKANTITLTDATFAKYITDRPRPYHALLLLTADAPEYGCTVCPGAVSNVEAVAEVVADQINFASSLPAQRIVFFVADFDACPELFRSLKVNSVPRSFLLPPAETSAPKSKLSDFAINDEVYAVSKLLALVSTKLDNPRLAPAYPSLPILAGLIVLAVLVAYLVNIASEDFNNLLKLLRSPYIWCFISVLCFCVGVSGSISCIIRSAPIYGRDKKSLQLFSGGSREQYLAEGIIVALWTVGCAVSLVFTYIGTKIPLPPLRHTIVILGMAMFVVFSLQIWGAYVDKTPWYTIKETLPPGLWTWTFSGLKKTSGLGKRLMRLSELYLTEYKDFKAFEKKARLILLDYIVKKFESYGIGGAEASAK